MQWTIRRRLNVIVGLTFATLIVMTLVDAVGAWRVEGRLGLLQRSYLPRLRLESQVNAAFVALVRSLQEAVAAEDEARLAAAEAEKERLLALMDAAPGGVDPTAMTEARARVETWFAFAVPVSRRLMAYEPGEVLVADVERMQALQRAAHESLSRALTLDRQAMGEVFQETASAERLSWTIRFFIRLVLTLVTFALAASLSRRLMGRVELLEKGFERFGAGRFDEPVPLQGNDELTEITVQANRMAANLQRMDEALHARRAELERANKELEAFSYSVSHDLRAPLRSIDGFSKALLEDYGQVIPAEGHDYLQRVRASSQRMAQLIDDMLTLSRIGRTELQRTRVDLTALARAVADDLRDTPDARPVEVQVEEHLTARADARLMRVVFENLLSNAYKFTGRTPEPLVGVGTCGVTDEGQVFYVRDNGVGFDEAYMEKLFTPFQRLHSAKDYPGTGVGLATVQRVVHMHGGRVWAASTAGEGATFFFTLGPES